MSDLKSSAEKKNRLEQYLEDIYENHCKFSISESEIEFIQKGVESVTLQYLQKKHKGFTCKEPTCKINHYTEIELIKVGSIYEGTRNGYPNEFDFIAVFGTVEEEPDWESHTDLGGGICISCDPYKSNEFPGATIELHIPRGPPVHGKTEKMEYLYKNENETKILDIDITLAFRCHSPEKFFPEKCIFNPDFYQKILSTGSFLFIYTGSSCGERSSMKNDSATTCIYKCRGPWDISVTETEMRFVRDCLGEKHKKVYKILKYLVNGDFGEELFKYLCLWQESQLIGPQLCISSYILKVAVIHHYYECRRETVDFTDCVLAVLKNLLLPFRNARNGFVVTHSLLTVNEMDTLIAAGDYEFLGNFYWCLKAFIARLSSLKTSNGLAKCNHDMENSFLEMSLRLDMFDGYVNLLSALDKKYSDPSILWHVRPKFYRLVEKVQQHNEKRRSVPECSWCDYPVYIFANKRT